MILLELDEIRKKIDEIDDQLIKLLRQRLDAAAEIAAWKGEHGLPVDDSQREAAICRRATERLGASYAPYGATFFDSLFAISRAYQQQCRAEAKTRSEPGQMKEESP
ncbi:MAG TPA: chorismate mutase [Clostridiales bacterium]|nr:chorismate mutase [Clostridiales bacterium]